MGTHVRERESHVREFDMVEVGALRRSVGAAIEALVDLLDSLDPDPDLEPASDELDASWPENGGQVAPPGGDRGEDLEPSLGSPEAVIGCWSALRWHTPLVPLGPGHGRESRHAGGGQERWGYHAGPVDAEEDAGEEPEAVNEDGGDILDQPHDDDDGYGGIFADADAVDQLSDEIAFQRWMDDSRPARFQVHEATRAQIMKVTGRKPDSHWGWAAWTQSW